MSTKQQAESSRSTFIWIAVGVVVVVGLFVWAIMSGGATSSGGGSYEVEAFGDVEVDGDALPILDPANVGIAELDPAAGLPAPVVTSTDFDGVASSVGDSGEPQLLVFLAHWCPHCQAEVPRLVDQMAGTSSIDGVQVVGIATSSNATRTNFPPAAWLDGEGWTGGLLMDDSDASALRAYGLGSFPAWAAVNADGTVAARATGELTPDQVSQLAGIAAGG